MSKDYKRETPPESGDEWADIWRAVERSSASWLIVGPIHAVVTNWKAIVAVVAFVAWVKRPEILAAIEVLIGGRP